MLLTPLAPVAPHPGCHSVCSLYCRQPLVHPPPLTSLPVCLRLLQVRLTEDLASSTARLSQLQLEASVHQQKAMELQTKLNSALQSIESHSQHIAGLEIQMEGLC